MTEPDAALEAEFVALATTHNALAPLDANARRRVLTRLCSRFMPEVLAGVGEQRRGDNELAPAAPVSVTTVEFGPGGFTETTTFTSAG